MADKNSVRPVSNQAPNDMLLALVGTFASAGGALLLATNTAGSSSQRMLGLGIALWGALTCLFLLVTGNLWRQKGNMPISIALATVLAIGGAGFVEVALHDADIQRLVRNTDSPSGDPTPPVSPAPEKTPEPEPDAEAVADVEAGEAPVDGEEAVAEEGDAATEAEATKAPPVADASTGRTTEPVAPVATESLDEELDLEELELEADSRSEAEERRRIEMEEAAKAASDKRSRREEERARKAKEAKEAKERAKRSAASAAPAATGGPMSSTVTCLP